MTLTASDRLGSIPAAGDTVEPARHRKGTIVLKHQQGLRSRGKWIGTVIAAVLIVVFGVASPASANTGLGGGARHLPCPGDSQGCDFYTNAYGDFAIVAHSSALEGCFNICLVAYGYLHKVDSSGTNWDWRIFDNKCDSTGVFFNSRGSTGCETSIGANVLTAQSSWHVNWGGASPGGVTYNPPTLITTDPTYWECPDDLYQMDGGLWCSQYYSNH